MSAFGPFPFLQPLFGLLLLLFLPLSLSLPQPLFAEATGPSDVTSNFKESPEASPLADEWTASVLGKGHFAVGSLIEGGTGFGLMIGADPSALAIGAKTAHFKWQLPRFGEDDWAVGLKYISITRNSIWLGDTQERFNKLDAKIIRPSVAWSNRISRRLIIHSFWASGFGKSNAELSDYGKRQLKEAKQGSADGDTARGDGHSFANRTMQMQSLAGFTEDRFQITAEWERSTGERIVLSTRFERTRLEQLETISLRLTLAQHWHTDGLNIRVGAGPQYAVLTGRDLDDSEIKAAGWLPAADFALYWLL